jgi:lysozyme
MSTWDSGIAMTKDFEGFKENPYIDTRGIPTVGYGFNLNAYPQFKGRKITRKEADKIFPELYSDAVNRAMTYADTAWSNLNPKQQTILIDMAYNLGDKLNDFKRMRFNLMKGDNEGVVKEMQNSKWYKQVGRRSKHHVENWSSE